jgi:hypothetical protein
LGIVPGCDRTGPQQATDSSDTTSLAFLHRDDPLETYRAVGGHRKIAINACMTRIFGCKERQTAKSLNRSFSQTHNSVALPSTNFSLFGSIAYFGLSGSSAAVSSKASFCEKMPFFSQLSYVFCTCAMKHEISNRPNSQVKSRFPGMSAFAVPAAMRGGRPNVRC